MQQPSGIRFAAVASAAILIALAFLPLGYLLVTRLRDQLHITFSDGQADPAAVAAMLNEAFLVLFAEFVLAAVIFLGCILALSIIRGSEVRHSRANMRKIGEFDALTNVLNRGALSRHIAQSIEDAMPTGSRVVVACIDIDRFKSVNEQFGLAEGDRLLKEFSVRIRSSMRESDILARIGNNAFAVVIQKVDANANITAILNRIRQAVHRPFKLPSSEVRLTVSIGVSIAPDQNKNADALIKQAEIALRHAKLAGRGNLEVFTDDMESRVRENLAIEAELRRAIEEEAIDVQYQPQIDTETGLIVGCEALVRWHNERFGAVSPARFIPIAEESGLIHKLSEFVLRRACSDAVQWPKPISIAINLSPTELASRNVPSMVAAALLATGLPAHRLELEVTESMVLQNSETTLHTLRDLRAMGVGIAIDDFGTGYSNLSYLAHFPFSKLKIDRAFVVASGQFPNMTAIIKAIVSLGKALGVSVIVEGVETKSQLERMKHAGCRLVQGYYYSKPLVQVDLISRLDLQSAEVFEMQGRVENST